MKTKEWGILLVAQQDEAGHVVAVWKRAGEDRTARPMTRNDLATDDLHRACYHGAAPREITSFIETLPR